MADSVVHQWAAFAEQFTRTFEEGSICLVCLAVFRSAPAAHFNDNHGVAQRSCPIRLLLDKGHDNASAANRMAEVLEAKDTFLTPYSNLCRMFTPSVDDVRRTKLLTPPSSFLEKLMPQLDVSILRQKADECWHQQPQVHGALSIVVLRGTMGDICGYHIGNGKFGWLPFACTSASTVILDGNVWYQLMTKLGEKCDQQQPVLVSFWNYKDYPSTNIRLRSIMPAQRMEVLTGTFTILRRFTSTLRVEGVDAAETVRKLWRDVLTALTEDEKKLLLLLSRMFNFDLDENEPLDEAARTTLKKTLKMHSRSKPFPVPIWRLIESAEILTDFRRCPVSVGSVARINQEFDFQVAGVSGELVELVNELLNSYIAKTSNAFEVLTSFGMTRGVDDRVKEADAEVLLQLFSTLPTQFSEFVRPLTNIREVANKNSQKLDRRMAEIFLHIAYISCCESESD